MRPKILVLEGLSGAASCVTHAGGLPIGASPRNLVQVEQQLRREVHGMLLTGGGDIDPRLYGQHPHKHVYGVSETRDFVEEWALTVAHGLGIPVLGICRGHQMLNVADGGTLHQHIDDHYTPHAVQVRSGSELERAVGTTLIPRVISLHHQEVKRPAVGFSVCGVAPDGTVEAIESDDGLRLGVQFHPEMAPGAPHSRALFRWLVTKAAEVAGLRGGAECGVAPISHSHPRQPPVKLSWFCRDCGIRFDLERDRIDHMAVVHGHVNALYDAARGS